MEQHNPHVTRMDAMADTVIEDPQLPSMVPAPEATDADVDEEQPGLRAVMDEPPPPSGGDEATMDTAQVDEEYPDMQPPSAMPGGEGAEGAAAFAANVDSEGYVRLLVEVEEGDMHILDASIVEGPLVQPELTGAMAYEVTVGDRRVGAGAFDDLTEQHGYAPPDELTLGHRVGEVSRFEFTVRIPRSEITQDELSRLRITLVRPQTTTQLSEDIAPAPGVSFEAAAIESGILQPPVIASLEGINLEDLPFDAAEALRGGLR